MTPSHRDAFRFTLITYGLSWLLWLPAIIQSLQGKDVGPVPFAVGFIGLMVPSITGFIFLRREAPAKTVLRQLFLPSKSPWLLLSFVLLPMVMVVSHAIHILFMGGQAPVIAEPYRIPLSFLTILLAGGPLFEEIGWRGYLQPKLLNNHSIWAAGLMVGVLWGIWHLPLFFIRGMFHTNLPLDQFFITVVLISVIICFLQVKARSGIWPVLLVHSFMNLTQDVTPLFNEQGHTLWTITNGVLGIIILTSVLFTSRTAPRRI